MTQLLTTSRLRTYGSCVRKHYYRYDLRKRPLDDEDGPRRFGSLHHTGQEFYWLGYLDGMTPQEALDVATARLMAQAADPFEQMRARALLDGYHFRWADETARWRVVAVELEFSIPLINPRTGSKSRKWRLGGKIDLIVELLDGPHAGLYVVEHKTSTEDISPGAIYWRKLRRDDQITIYIDGARSLGYDVRGCIYDVAARPLQQPYKATPEEDRQYTQPKPERPGKPCKEHKDGALAAAKAIGQKLLVRDIPNFEGCAECTPPKPAEPSRLYANQRAEDETPVEFYERISNAIAANPDAYYRRSDPPVVRLEDELTAMRQNIWWRAQEMVADQRREWHPQNPSACGDFHRLCEYADVCDGDIEITDESRYESGQRHPELSPEIQNHPEPGKSDNDNDRRSSEQERAA